MANLPTISMVEASDPHSLVDAAQYLYSRANDPFSQFSQFGKIAQDASEHLKGDAEEARLVAGMGEHLAAQGQLQQFAAMSSDLDSWGNFLVWRKNEVSRVVAEAKETEFTVHDNGDVEGPADKAAEHDRFVQEIHETLMSYATDEENAAGNLRQQVAQLKALGEGTSGNVLLAESEQEASAKAQRDANVINRGDPTGDEQRQITEDLKAHGLTPAQIQAVMEGKATDPPRLSPEQSAYTKTFLKLVDRDALVKKDTNGIPLVQKLDKDGDLSGMILAGTSPNTVFSDGSKGGRDMANKTLRAPERIDARTATDLGELATVLGGAKQDSFYGSQLTQDMLTKTSEYGKFLRDGQTFNGIHPTDADVQNLEHAIQAGGRDHVSMKNLLTGDLNGTGIGDSKKAAEEMEGLLTYKWPHDGAALASTIGWIQEDAAVGVKNDPVEEHRASLAGHAASALADLTTRANESGGGPNLYKALMGNPNPAFTQALGDAMTPYLGDIAEAHGVYNPADTREFKLPDKDEHYDLRTMLFSVIDSDDKAAQQFNAKAEVYARALQSDYADSVADHQGASHREELKAAGRLQGLVEAGAEAEATNRYGTDKANEQQHHDRVNSVLGVAQQLANQVLGKIPGEKAGDFILKHFEDELKKELNPSVNVPMPNPRADYTSAHSEEATAYNLLTELYRKGVPLPDDMAALVRGMTPGGQAFPYSPAYFKEHYDDALAFLESQGFTQSAIGSMETTEQQVEIQNKDSKDYRDHRRP